QENDILLFPNPVTDEFQISFQSDSAGMLQIDIIDIQGKEIQQSTPSTSAATTASTPSKSPTTAPSPKPTGKPAHNCPNMGSRAHGNPSTSGFYGMPGQPNG
ncbi:MAG: T9SS type A sorting domain-containing protein, partial [Streptosporangiaceae bacterium]